MRFLVVDDNAEGRTLLNRTLRRRFPGALVTECREGDAAARLARDEKFDAILVHRAAEMDQESLILALRAILPETIIVALSGYNRSAKALAAGATAFLNYEKWLMVGSLVAELMNKLAPHSTKEMA